MNKVYLQIWEESDFDWGIRPDGCSLHLSIMDRNIYIDSIYSKRDPEIPKEYERIIGEPVEVSINDQLFKFLEKSGSLRLMENELNNLLSLEELVINDA